MSEEKSEEKKEIGMTLRDYFAAAALTGLMATRTINILTAEDYARQSFELADAMLNERDLAAIASAQNERDTLRAENAKLTKHRDEAESLLHDKCLEIDRLREALETAEAALISWSDRWKATSCSRGPIFTQFTQGEIAIGVAQQALAQKEGK